MTKKERDEKRKSSKKDVVMAHYEYKDPDYYRNRKLKEPTEFVSWEEFLEVTEKSPDWIMKG